MYTLNGSLTKQMFNKMAFDTLQVKTVKGLLCASFTLRSAIGQPKHHQHWRVRVREIGESQMNNFKKCH